MREHGLFLSGKIKTGVVDTPHHYHTGYEIILVEDGEIDAIIGNKRYRAGAGSVVCIGNLDEHNVEVIQPPYRRLYLILDSAQTDRKVESHELLAPFKTRTEDFSPVVTLSEEEFAEAKDLALRILQEAEKDLPYADKMMDSLVCALLVKLFRAMQPSLTFLSTPQFSTAANVQTFLDANFQETITLEEIAAQFFVNKYYLSHIFKQYTGFSVMQYLQKARLAYAKKLLSTTDLSVRDISTQCNFGDESNFIRCFKREYAATPLAYRKAVQKK